MPGILDPDLPESDEELYALIWRDDLTGLYNRRYFARFMKQEADWSEGATPVALAMMDLDNLKRINDRLGHMAGDATLKRLGQVFKSVVGSNQYAVRYAGDEFALILPGASRDEAIDLANRLREAVVKDDYEEANLPEGLRPSLSIGVAVFPDDAPQGGDELTEAADKALYYSKRTGKNKVTSAADLQGGAEEISDIEALSGFPARSLVGRKAAFQTVDEVISLVNDGHDGFLLVEGAGGTGKTRLLSEVGKYAKERELAVLIEKCSQVTREEPYRALGGLLDAYLKKHPDLLERASASLTPQQVSALREVLPALGRAAPPAGERPSPPRGVPRSPIRGRPPAGRRPGPPPRPGQSGRFRRPGPPPRRPGPAPGAARRPAPARPARPTPPPKAPRPAGGRDPAELTVSLFTGMVELLEALGKVRPLVVILDDFEHADEATLEVIRRCMPREGHVLFVGAARTEAGRRGAGADEDAPYVAFREHLREHPGQYVIELQPLEREATVELAGLLLEGFRPPVELADRIYALSGGNPLFIEGVLRHLIETGTLKRAANGWNVKGELPREVPLSLEDLIRQQLKILDPRTADLLREAAVVGPVFEFNVLRASSVTAASEDEALNLVDDAVQARMVRETGEAEGSQYEFTSTSVQATTYETMDPERRRTAHRRVAEAIDERPGEAAAKAYHFGRAGDREKRDRFLTMVRERKDQIFDREAIESLGDGQRPLIPEVTDPAPAALLPCLPAIAKAMATAAKSVRLYPATSKVVGDNLEALTGALGQALDLTPAFTLSHRGNALVANGHTVDKAYGEGQFQETVAGIYRVNSIKSLTFVKSPTAQELLAFLTECAQHTVQTPVPRHFWSVFAREHGLKHLGVVQKSHVLKGKRGASPSNGVSRIAEADLPLVKDLIRHLAGAILAVRSHPPGSKVPAEALAHLDRTLRNVFQEVPALAVHQGEEESIVVNGTPLLTKAIPSGGPELLSLLDEGRLRGLVFLRDITPRELARFVTKVARLTPRDFDGGKDPLAKISADGSFPNILVGEALFHLAQDLLGKAEEAPAAGPTEPTSPPTDELDEGDEEVPPRDPDLPEDFEWPSDAVAQRAKTLCALKPHELIREPGAGDMVEVLEMLLLDRRPKLAQKLIERLAINFASQEASDRVKAAEQFLALARRGSQELRAAYFAVAVRRLGDALELETDYDAFEKLCGAAKYGVLERIAEGEWDIAARLVWSMNRRRETRVEAQTRMREAAASVLRQVLEDPRAERVFETIETGSQQERRKAARILEGMGAVAVDRLVRFLEATGRPRVESFLIDMLAALAPDSEKAVQKAVTPYAPSESTRRLLRASGVVCRDPTSVLVSGLQNPDPTVQTEAVAVARGLGGKVAQKVLSWALQHGSPAAQLAAVKHLGELARPDAVDELIDLLGKTNIVEVQRECCLTLGKLALDRRHQDKVVPVLVSYLRAGSFLRAEHHEDVRRAAAWALGQMRHNDAARKALERALEDKDDRVRLTAKLTLEGRT